jgi:hypothetical protein
MKPYSPQEAEKLQNNKDIPTVHVTLPSNDRELSGKVLTHDSQETLDQYFRTAYQEEEEGVEPDEEVVEIVKTLDLPDNKRGY